MSGIRSAWKGEEKLWKVFWLYNFLAGIFIGFVLGAIPDGTALFTVVAIAALAWVIWATVSIWRCAFNAGWKGWGYIVRVLVVLSLISLVSDLLLPIDGNGAVA